MNQLFKLVWKSDTLFRCVSDYC